MDFKQLSENLMLEEDEYRELVVLFIDTGTEEIQRLESAIMAGDEKAVKRCAHSLAGASGNLGISEIHALAKDIENNTEQYAKDDLNAKIRKIEMLIANIKNQL